MEAAQAVKFGTTFSVTATRAGAILVSNSENRMGDTKEAAIKTWLQDVTYRPGWSVDFAGDLTRGLYITVNATEPNVCSPGEEFHTSPLFRVPDEVVTREQFLDWVLDVCIPGVEKHERYEWFRVDGKHWRDPHAPGMPAFATDFARSTTGGSHG